MSESPLDVDMPDLTNKIGFLLHDVSRMRRTFFDQALKPLGITRSQWWLLANIHRHADTGMIQTDLAKMLETGKVTVGGLVDRLEEANLVYRKPDALDRRVRRIYITDLGYEVLEQLWSVSNELDAMLSSDITDDEIEIVASVLGRLKNNLRLALRNPPTIKPLQLKKTRRASRRPASAA